jgi:signal transduction histidine kinase
MQNDKLETLAKEKEQNHLKNDYLSRVNYAMRAPLISILEYCELLLSQNASPEEQTSFVRVIQHNGTHLLNLIGDLQQLSEIESNVLEIHNAPCSPRSIVEEVAAAMSPVAEAKELDFTVEYVEPIPAYIDCDQKYVTQILLKLADNAIKYTEVGNVHIVVEASSVQESATHLHFSVIDTAGEISQENVERLFQIFSRVRSPASKRPEGTGIGLAIAKKLADLINGELIYQPNAGVGSTFTLTLPT